MCLYTFSIHILSAAVIFEYITIYLILHIIDVIIDVMYIDCVWNANLHNSRDVNSLYISRQCVNITNLRKYHEARHTMTKFTSTNTRDKLREISDTQINYDKIRIHSERINPHSIHALLRSRKRKKNLQCYWKHLFNQTNELLYFDYKSFSETLLYIPWH